MLSPTDAARKILAAVVPLALERVALRDALGRTLAETVRSKVTLPPWDNSAMDGYAVRSDDVPLQRKELPVELHVVETIPAGTFPRRTLREGEAARIFTGAPVPSSADAVIRQEDTEIAGQRVRILDNRDRGKNVRRRGEDVQEGDVVLEPPRCLGAAELGVLASMAEPLVSVHRVPRVAYLATGDEIVDLDQADEVRAGRKIASSNSYTLDANIRLAGGDPVNLGIAGDTKDSLHAHLRPGLEADLLITTAGVSVGEHDHVREVLEDLGLDLRFWRIRMRPGAPVGFGIVAGIPWIGLPGNPVSTMVTFELFVRPAIRRMAGHALPFRRAVPVRAGEEIHLGPALRHFQRVQLRESPGEAAEATLTGPQGSGILTSMVKADALLIVPEDVSHITVGQCLQAIRLNETTHVEQPPF